jgi:hypothetical protein
MHINRIFSILIVGLLVLGILPAISPVGADDSRVLDHSIIFTEAGTNTTISEVIPKGSVVTTATLTIKGETYGTPEEETSYDYADKGQSDAYMGETSNQPVSGDPSGYMNNVFQDPEYTEISISDDRWAYTSTTPGNQMMSAYQHYQFKVTSDPASEIEILWEGWGWDLSAVGRPNYKADIYIWNDVDSAWESVGSSSGNMVDENVTHVIDTDAEEYVDDEDIIHIVAQTGKNMIAELYADYVRVNVTTGGERLPTDPALDVGNDGDEEWSASGEYDGSESVDFKTELQSHIDAAGYGLDNVTVVFAFSSEGPGKLEVHDLNIQYDPPAAPVWSDIEVSLQEDDPNNEGDNLIDLYEVITDDKDEADLTFAITYEEDSTKLDATLDADGYHLDFTPADDWWGEMDFKVKATDIDLRESEVEFTVTVNSVNDPPVITPVTPQPIQANAGVPLQLTLTASDVDTELDPTEAITWSDNTDMFDIDPQTGVIDFTPLKEHIGQKTVSIFASDNEGAKDSEVLGIAIGNYDGSNNREPVLEPIGDLVSYEETEFSVTVTATDEDLIYGDALTFSDDSDLFDIKNNGDGTADITFTPAQEDVGVYDVVITVSDFKGETDEEFLELAVVNVNDPPTLDPFTSQTIKEGETLKLTASADDVDLPYDVDEVLTFSDDTTLFDIDPSTGEIDWEASYTDAGSYTITIKVTDNYGATANDTLALIVENVNRPPEVDDPLPEGKTTVEKGETITANASDPDNEDLTYEWKDEDGNVIAEGPELDTKLLPTGKQKITLVVSDGNDTTEKDFDIKVKKKDSGTTTGFELVLVMMAMMVCIAVARRRR